MAENYIDRIEIDGVERPIRDTASGAVRFQNITAAFPETQTYRKICNGGGKYVIIPSKGVNAAYSADGITWTKTTMPADTTWQDCCYGNGKFVAISAYGIGAYSTDGINWTQTTIPALPTSGAGNWYICYGNGLFVTVCDRNGEAAYSADGITWTETALTNAYDWAGVCFGDGKFLTTCVTDGKLHANYSTDGINWTHVEAAPSYPASSGGTPYYGDGRFICKASGVAYSDDCINWTFDQNVYHIPFNGACYGAGKFVYVPAGEGSIARYSTDGISWAEAALPLPTSVQVIGKSICYGNNGFVAACELRDPLLGRIQNVLPVLSDDGITWYTEVKMLTDKDGADIHEDVRDALEIDLSAKQDKLTGTAGQVVGFDANGSAVAQDAPGPVITLVTLSGSGWSSKTQTVTVSGVLADEGAQRITVAPNMAGMSAYRDAGVWCSGQAADSLTFSCDTVPTADIAVYVTVEGVRSA